MRLEGRFSYANVMSTLAVFLAIAGGSVAVAGVPADSVDSQSVIDETLKSRDLLNGEGVRSVDVENRTLGAIDIEADAVTDAELAPDAVADSELAPNSVNADEVVADSLGAGDLAASSVGSSEVALNAIGTGEIDLNAVESGDIATSAVGTTEIFDNSVSATDLAGSSVNDAEIVDESVDADEITDGSVGGDEIANSGVDASEIGDFAIYQTSGEQVFVTDPDSARNGDIGLGAATVDCNTDRVTGELLSGSGKWIDSTSIEGEDELYISEIRLNMDTETVTVVGGIDTGNDAAALQAEAICLEY